MITDSEFEYLKTEIFPLVQEAYRLLESITKILYGGKALDTYRITLSITEGLAGKTVQIFVKVPLARSVDYETENSFLGLTLFDDAKDFMADVVQMLRLVAGSVS